MKTQIRLINYGKLINNQNYDLCNTPWPFVLLSDSRNYIRDNLDMDFVRKCFTVYDCGFNFKEIFYKDMKLTTDQRDLIVFIGIVLFMFLLTLMQAI